MFANINVRLATGKPNLAASGASSILLWIVRVHNTPSSSSRAETFSNQPIAGCDATCLKRAITASFLLMSAYAPSYNRVVAAGADEGIVRVVLFA